MDVFVGLLRDFLVAVFAVLVLVGVSLDDELVQRLIAGLVLLVSTGAALGTFVYARWKEYRSRPRSVVPPPAP